MKINIFAGSINLSIYNCRDTRTKQRPQYTKMKTFIKLLTCYLHLHRDLVAQKMTINPDCLEDNRIERARLRPGFNECPCT